jgi:Fic/DOC family
MAAANRKLASALQTLKRLQDKQDGVVESADLSDAQRRLLVDQGFLRPVVKGWYVCANPADAPGDTTVWYASFWAFLAGYLRKRFGKRYCLNPEASLLLETGNTVVPRQVVVATKLGGSNTLELPHDTSLLLYHDEARVPRTRTEVRGLQVWPLAEALCRVGPRWFTAYPQDAQIALAQVRDVAELLAVLLQGQGLLAAAGRLAGALRFCGRAEEADRLLATMRTAGFEVRESNPFEIEAPTLVRSAERSPYALRIAEMWTRWREPVIGAFPLPGPVPTAARALLKAVDERYAADAYNSLSIEGYQVTDALIERVARRGWNLDGEEEDQRDRDVLAARGYYDAFQAVRETVTGIVGAARRDGPELARAAGRAVRHDHHRWYGALFGPGVKAGILKAHQLAGYRNGPVYIRQSKHVPPPREAVLDAMETLFDLITAEPHAAARAVLAHHLFAFIHPYFDGNGRMARFLMNVLLVTGGYPWTVVRVKRRSEYLATLEAATTGGRIEPFAAFLADEMRARPEPRSRTRTTL